jgi:hypothetical protein
LIGVLAGAAVAVAGGAAVWWVLGYRGEQVEILRDADAEQNLEVRPTTKAENPRSGEVPAIEHVQRDSTDQGAARPDLEPSIGSESDAADLGTSADFAPAETGVATSEEPAPTAAAAGDPSTEESDERVFLVDADLGYATLTVDYIVYRPDDPFAEINGLEVHEGSHVAGFVVEKIERDLVRLRDDKGPLIIRVHPADPDAE